MNDPNKRIDVNISSLLSLKAELLRKQEEVSKAKAKQSAEPFVPKRTYKPETQKTTEEPEPRKNIIEYEDSALLEKSRRVLEAKSKFYDKMAASGGKLNSDDNCLVMFNHKKQDENVTIVDVESSSDDISDNDDNADKYKARHPNEEWVEYTDCLGRSRQCLKKDLEFFKKKDTKLAENIQPRMELNQDAPMWMIDTKGDSVPSEIPDDTTEMTSMISKHDQQKLCWEKKEGENAYKENVHYQDVLFDEARTHGVGYYAFSTDDEERAKQKKALDTLREKTLAEQKVRESQRTNREKIIAERVKAAKNRQRARLGLPPVEDEPEPQPELFDNKEEEKRKKREEKEKRRKEKEEKKKDDERKRHVRPWDREKSGVKRTADYSDSESDTEWEYRPERLPMSQEQWNDKERDKRNPEFAPVPENPSRSFRSTQFATPVDFVPVDNKNSLYFTTKRADTSIPKKFVRRSYTNASAEENVGQTIRNELIDDKDSKTETRTRAEIPPPATFDYYGPATSKRQKLGPRPDLEKSIEAGLRFLRNRSDKGELPLPTKSSWTANADY